MKRTHRRFGMAANSIRTWISSAGLARARQGQFSTEILPGLHPAMRQRRADALLVGSDPFFASRLQQIGPT
jgi:hypothetical protein